MIVGIMIEIVYSSAVFALLTKNSGVCGDKRNRIQVGSSSMQMVEEALL